MIVYNFPSISHWSELIDNNPSFGLKKGKATRVIRIACFKTYHISDYIAHDVKSKRHNYIYTASQRGRLLSSKS